MIAAVGLWLGLIADVGAGLGLSFGPGLDLSRCEMAMGLRGGLPTIRYAEGR